METALITTKVDGRPKHHLAGWSQAQIDATFLKISFTDLPAEIRLMIYALALGSLDMTVLKLDWRDFRVCKDLRYPFLSSECSSRKKVPFRLPTLVKQPVSKQVTAEAKEMFWSGANFITHVADSTLTWFDTSAPYLKTHGFMPWQSIRNITVVINLEVSDGAARKWLKTRMWSRKNCLFFGQFPSLTTLKIAFIQDHYCPTKSFVDDADLPGIEDLVTWLLRGIPTDVDLQWITLSRNPHYDLSCLDAKSFRDLEAQNTDVRGTSIGIPKDRRRPRPVGVEPAFLQAWTEHRKLIDRIYGHR